MLTPLGIGKNVIIKEAELSVHFPFNGATIRLCGADKPDTLRGTGLRGAIIDETGQIKPHAWTEAILPQLTDTPTGWCWFLGTPQGVNLLSELYYKSFDRPQWGNALYSVYDTDVYTQGEIDNLMIDVGDTGFAREYLCDFAAAGENQLISITDLRLAAQRNYGVYEPLILSAPKILGVDMAREGDDRSVIMPRQGLQVFDPLTFRNADNMEMVGHIASKIDSWGADAVFIDRGEGSGVYDRLIQLGYNNVFLVNFGAAASNPAYENKRVEMWADMAEAVVSGLSIPNDEGLIREMAAPTYKFNSRNRKQLESKTDVKKRLQSVSTDKADALALTYAHPVAIQTGNSGRRFTNRDYDPMTYRRAA